MKYIHLKVIVDLVFCINTTTRIFRRNIWEKKVIEREGGGSYFKDSPQTQFCQKLKNKIYFKLHERETLCTFSSAKLHQ